MTMHLVLKPVLACLAALAFAGHALAQTAAADAEIGRAYGEAVTKAVLLAETLALLEKKCSNLAKEMDYLKIVEKDRAEVARIEPQLNRLVAMLVPATTEKMIEADGGCGAERLKERHAKLQANFAEDAMKLMQGNWHPKK